METSSTPREEFRNKFHLTDEEVLALGVSEHNVESYRRAYYTQQFAIDTWYLKLSEHTFQTTQLEMTFEEAEAIRYYHLKNVKLLKDGEEPHKTVLEDLVVRIDKTMKEMGVSKVMIKLKTRSPKDVPVYDFENKDLQARIDRWMREGEYRAIMAEYWEILQRLVFDLEWFLTNSVFRRYRSIEPEIIYLIDQ